MDDLFEEDDTNIQGVDIQPNQWKFIPPRQVIKVGEKKTFMLTPLLTIYPLILKPLILKSIKMMKIL